LEKGICPFFVFYKEYNGYNMDTKIPVEVSARHCHLCPEDLEKLFGKGHELTQIKQLSQPSDFACEEAVEIEFGSKKFENVRVVGPLRKQTQVEISLTDAVGSGVIPPARISGDLKESESVIIRGPKGAVKLKKGLIVALRHLHCATNEAASLGIKMGDKIKVRVAGARAVVFEDVDVRVGDHYNLCLHLDTDEGNAAFINKIGEGEITK